MASDLFPIPRDRPDVRKNASDDGGLLKGNPLSDALLRAFRQTFGTASNDAAAQHGATGGNYPDGTIVPPSGETNP